jgi:hypothetical protein
MSKNPGPDQKFRKISETIQISHIMCNVKKSWPGSEIQKNSGSIQTCDVMCNVKKSWPV